MILYVAALAFSVLPALIAYTVVAGDKAEARVLSCHHSHTGRRHTRTCTGTWITSGGSTGDGKIYNVDERDYGRDVALRIGPLGPYGHGFGRHVPTVLGSCGIGVGACLTVLVMLVLNRRKKDAAATWRASRKR
ncbi:hypothetical protein EBO15_27055 [Actinomadura harenae]|uniref:Uncharacterized protein n=1 Tax=Actinomadura harenae TaxID=2483351 RepID=A0A3M2LW95_9ACTN|nr:hypothetical protein EBO15_27055 [Actinomadura harenae]